MHEFYEVYINICLAFCSVMVLFWVLRFKTWKKRSKFMICIYVLLTFLFLTLKIDLDLLWVILLSGTMALVLLIDLILRLFYPNHF